MQNKPFWHEISDKEAEEVLASKITIGEFMEKYRQPSWCSYSDALSSTWGCWSLMRRKGISLTGVCKKCECCENI